MNRRIEWQWLVVFLGAVVGVVVLVARPLCLEWSAVSRMRSTERWIVWMDGARADTALGTEFDDADVPYLRRLKAITMLELKDSEISPELARSIGELTKMETIVLINCSGAENLATCLPEWPSLRSVVLAHSVGVNASLCREIADVDSLRQLTMDGTDVTAEGLAAFHNTKLNYLLLHDNQDLSSNSIRDLVFRGNVAEVELVEGIFSSAEIAEMSSAVEVSTWVPIEE